MQANPLVRALVSAISIAVVALALLGATWYGSDSAHPAGTVVGVPTGRFVNGAEIHRLPSISVTARRSDAADAPVAK